MGDEPKLELILWATDVTALAGFLERVAGATVEEQHPGFAHLATGSSRFAIHADEAYQGHPWHDALYQEGVARGIGAELRFAVTDVSEAYRRAIREGASVVYPPHEQEGAVECQILGPDGYLITLRQPPAG